MVIPIQVIKKDGTKQLYNPSKIMNAIHLSFKATGKEIGFTNLQNITSKVEEKLNNSEINRDEIDNAVINTLKEETFFDQANEYESYCTRRRRLKNILVSSRDASNSTDLNLLIESDNSKSLMIFNPIRIIKNLEKQNLGISKDKLNIIAKQTEHEILDLYDKQKDSNNNLIIDTDTIRALIASTMVKMGFNPEQILKAGNYGMPREDLQSLIASKTKENANVGSNNPESVSLGIWETLLKKFALNEVFSADLKEAHLLGRLHIHDLGYIVRVYCSGHSPAYLKKYGLDLDNLDTESSPAKHAITLSGHISTFLASMQAYYAGALGLSYLNLEFAPFVRGLSKKEIKSICDKIAVYVDKDPELKKGIKHLQHNFVDLKQIAQNLIFTQSQSAFSRGSQTLFIDFNLHTGVPQMLVDIPIICPGGVYRICDEDGSNEEDLVRINDKSSIDGLIFKDMDGNILVDHEGKFNRKLLKEKNKRFVTYKDYEKEAQDFLDALLDVYIDGDSNGKMFAFPKCDVHVNEQTFRDEREIELLKKTCSLAAKNSSAYFIFDRDSVTMAACCRLRTSVDPAVLEHPESLRFCGFQNITINMPQAAYRAVEKGDKSIEGLISEINDSMDLAFKAHIQKRKFIEGLMKPGMPLWQIGKKSKDGKPYVDLDGATYIIGMIGLNEALKTIIDEELHDSQKALQAGEEVIAAMFQRKNEYVKQTGWKFSIEESPAESAARNLAKRDISSPKWGVYAKKVHQGTTDDPYYTNSVHFRADAPNISGIDRIINLSKFHPVIESGAIIHLFTGESDLDVNALYDTIKKTYDNTQCAQITVSAEHTSCHDCGEQMRGFKEICIKCSGKNLTHTEKVVGYNSTVENWNSSKVEESKARSRGNYCVDVGLFDEEELQLNKEKPLKLYVFGRKPCSSCDELKSKVNKIFSKDPSYLKRIEVEFVDLGDKGGAGRKGLVKAMSSAINISEIPSMTVALNSTDGVIRPISHLGNLSTRTNLKRMNGHGVLFSEEVPIQEKDIEEKIKSALDFIDKFCEI